MDPHITKLPFWQTVWACYRLTWRHAGTILSYSWPLLIVLLLTRGLITWVTFEGPQKTISAGANFWTGDTILMFTQTIAFILASAMIAVPWHRYLLLGTPPTTSDLNPFQLRIWRYMKWELLIFVPLIPAIWFSIGLVELGRTVMPPVDAEIITPLDKLLMGFGLLPGWLVAARISPVYPARAVDDMSSLSSLWNLTQGNSWRLMAGAGLAIAPSWIGSELCALLIEPTAKVSRLTSVASDGVTDLIDMTAGMTIVTFLSLAFIFFRRMPAPEAALGTAA